MSQGSRKLINCKERRGLLRIALAKYKLVAWLNQAESEQSAANMNFSSAVYPITYLLPQSIIQFHANSFRQIRLALLHKPQ